MEEPTAQIAQKKKFSQQMKDMYDRLESGLRSNASAENRDIKEFENQSTRVIAAKKEAQRRIHIAVKYLRKHNFSELIAPENVLQFEKSWDQLSAAIKVLEKQVRTYSLGVKIFINIFLHEARALKSVPVKDVIANVEQKKKYILETEQNLTGTFEKVYSDLQQISKFCNNQVERFIEVGGTKEESGEKVVLVQFISDFIISYEEICKTEQECFRYVAKFLKKNKKALKEANEDAAVSRKMMKHDRMDIKDFWVYYEPHVKLWHTVIFLGNVAIFTQLGVEFGILGGKFIKGFSNVFFGAKLSAATFGLSHCRDLKKMAKLAEDVI